MRPHVPGHGGLVVGWLLCWILVAQEPDMAILRQTYGDIENLLKF